MCWKGGNTWLQPLTCTRGGVWLNNTAFSPPKSQRSGVAPAAGLPAPDLAEPVPAVLGHPHHQLHAVRRRGWSLFLPGEELSSPHTKCLRCVGRRMWGLGAQGVAGTRLEQGPGAGGDGGIPKPQLSSPQGDSGGPLVYQNGNAWTLIGIVSWGSSNCNVRTPAVYTRVSHFRNWIDQIVAQG